MNQTLADSTVNGQKKQGERKSYREHTDRELFNRVATNYARKDEHVASGIARKHRLLQTFRCVRRPYCDRLLEIGCGAGYGAAYLDGKYAHYCGIDYSERLVEYARERHKLPNARFEVANAMQLDCEEKYDVIFMIGVLHHVTDIDKLLSRLTATLAPGGIVVANEPQPGNPLIQIARRVRKRIDGDYSDEQVELTHMELEKDFLNAGLVNIRSRPQGLFSTPFAEVPMRPQFATGPISKLACWTDGLLERVAAKALTRLSWNVIVTGERPA